jgi:3-oxoacyl-[acyl-carrier protein] reductase
VSDAAIDPSAPDADRHLADRVAVVTGASRGIGRSIALRLAARGARVACIATSAENAAETAAACEALGTTARAYGVDVSDTVAVGELVKEIGDELGPVDILVNNAGVTRDQILLRMSEEDFDRVLDVNLKGAWNFSKAACRTLMKTSGCLINVSSVVGLTGNAGQSNYAASKAGLLGLTRSLAKELASRRVRVNAVAPGYIDTDMTSGLDEKAAEELRTGIPLGRVGTPAEIAWAVDYLVGPGGAYVTGQVLVVDGGLAI